MYLQHMKLSQELQDFLKNYLTFG